MNSIEWIKRDTHKWAFTFTISGSKRTIVINDDATANDLINRAEEMQRFWNEKMSHLATFAEACGLLV